MNNNDRRSIEGSHDEDGGAGNENQNGDFINANLLDKKQLEGLKSSVDWEVESQRYIIFDQFFRLIGDWKGPLSDLRNIFQLEEIERLLIDSIARWGTSEGENQAIRFIRFLVETGYKDKPKVDKDGKLMLHRRTALLCAYSKGIYPFGRELFKIYDRFDVNYIDEKSSYTHFHVACQWGCMDVVEKFLELGRVDPNLLVTTTGSSPLHVTLESDHVDPKIVEILLRHGANPNVANRAGLTPVHFVSKRPNNHGTNAHLLEMFCELANEKYKPVQINVASEAGLTPLDYAVARQCKSLTKSLLRFGADPNFTTVKGLTTLHKICSYDNLNVKLVKMLFKYKPVKVDAQDDQGYTPMHYAVNRCHQSVVELLLRNGSDPNSPNLEGSTPLHVICDNRSDDAEFLEAFLKICKDTHQKLRIEARDKKGRTPLELASDHVDPKIVEILLRHGANPNVANRAGLTPVHFVSKRPNNHGTNAHLLEMFCELANEKYKPVQINVASEAGLTPLDYAVARQCKSLTKSLLRFGADPNFTTVKGLTTLHKICSYDNLNVKLVKMLFKYKPVKVDAQDDQGYTPMHYAVNRCHQSVVELLLRNGSDPNSPNLEGSTPLHVICDNRSDDAEFLEAFLKICKDTHQKLRIEARDKKGRTPLKLASDHVDPKIVEILLRHGANPNVANRAGLTPVHFVSKRPNNHGTNAHLLEMFCELANEKYKPVQINVASEAGLTPLDYAVARQCKSLTKSLLRFGADPNFTTVKGLTTLHKICSYDNLNVKLVKMLFKYKPVKVDAQDDQGYTPMHYAVNRCHQSVVELLLRNGSDPNSPNLEGSTPLHVICDNRSDDAEFLEAFLKICKDTHQKLRIEARDKKGRTPLELAVGNILPNTVDVLLNQGAGLSSFVFPTVKQFDEINDYRKHVWCSKLLVASGLLMIVERLEKRGYELVQSDALTIMEFFTKYDLRESSDVEEPWYDEESFEIEAKKIMVKPSLSLYDLTRLRPEKAAKMLTYRHYLKLTCTKISKLSKEFRRNCAEHLCEKLARPFFRRWTLYPFWEQIVLYRLPLLCCDMMIDNLKNKDLFNICLAATKQ
uniref:Uncharacterized protein n=1 Tax=Trichogramma kaykai TaxID=54128 RepID=A0ABD2X4J4_9HYME